MTHALDAAGTYRPVTGALLPPVWKVRPREARAHCIDPRRTTALNGAGRASKSERIEQQL
jgi:hypothetical protein